MATIKSIFKRFNGTDFDIHLFETSADLINETTSFKVLSAEERSRIELFLLGHTPDTSEEAGPFDTNPKGQNDPIFNAANKLVQLDADGEIPVSLIPGGLDYLDTNNPTFTGQLTGPTVAATVIKLGNDDERIEGAQEAIEIYADDSLLVSFGAQSIDYQGNRIQNIGTPTSDNHAATKAYVDVVVGEGVKPVAPVFAATASGVNIASLSGAPKSIDGLAVGAGNRVLVKDQLVASENGIYDTSAGDWTKVEADSVKGVLVFVANGTQNNDSKFFATDDTTWILFSRTDTITEGAGLTKTGTQLSISNGAITNAMLAGSINENKIADFVANKTVDAEQTYGDGSEEFSLKAHIDQIASFLNRLRGDSAEDLTNTLPITLAGAALKNRTFVEASNPSTTGKVTGDLVFQTLT